MNTAMPFGESSRPITDTSNSGSSPRDCFRSSPRRNPPWSGSPSAPGYGLFGQGWPPPNRSWQLPSAIPSRNFSQVPPTPQSSRNSSATGLICPEPKELAWRHEPKTLTYRYSQVCSSVAIFVFSLCASPVTPQFHVQAGAEAEALLLADFRQPDGALSQRFAVRAFGHQDHALARGPELLH